jgi:hypothetical protein
MQKYNLFELQYLKWNFHIHQVLFSIFFFNLIIFPKKEVRKLHNNVVPGYTYDFKFYNLSWKYLDYFYSFILQHHFNYQIIIPILNNQSKTKLRIQTELEVIKNFFIPDKSNFAISGYLIFNQAYNLHATINVSLLKNFYKYIILQLQLRFKLIFYLWLLLNYKMKHQK